MASSYDLPVFRSNFSSCPFELASDLRHVIEFTQTEEKLGPGEMVFLLNAEDRVAAPLCLQSNPSEFRVLLLRD